MFERLARGRRPTPVLVRRLALAAVVANIGIVLTGGAVRLTGSGLGCPTWPSCTEASYVPTAAYGSHGLIEFGNRLLSFAVTLVAVALVLAVRRQQPRRPDLVRLATLGLLGIPAQAVLGGITVLTGLNPWSVMAHFLLSMGLIAVAVMIHRRAGEGDVAAAPLAPAGLRTASYALWGVAVAVLALGTVVTGSGPHSGDPEAGRTGFDPEVVSQIHADLVFVLVGATAALWLAFRATGSAPAARAALALLCLELAQGVVGFVQYWTDLPVLLVALHMLGACLTIALATRLVLMTRDRGAFSPGPAAPPLPAAAPNRVPV
ncbi:MAG: cytochrome oxidase assembly protein [Frankiales bacterium]|nr:cytochrome oxidase assembly protein [Frankiales bacterium]